MKKLISLIIAVILILVTILIVDSQVKLSVINNKNINEAYKTNTD